MNGIEFARMCLFVFMCDIECMELDERLLNCAPPPKYGVYVYILNINFKCL